MPLLRCTEILGAENIIEPDPAILTLPEVIYIPMGEPGWGIFDHGGRLVPPCSYWSGPTAGPAGNPHSNPLVTSVRYHEVVKRAPESVYVYGGLIAGHYGHFLLTTLCRYWVFDNPSFREIKILYHAPEDISGFFEKAYVADLFGALGLRPENFVRFSETTKITSLIVPCPSFEETGFAHRAFARLCQKLGDRLTSGQPMIKNETPVYLSKAKLCRGVRNMANELEFGNVLSKYGIDIVYPEELSLSDQILLFRSRSIISGLRGSALHTSIFARGCIIVGLAHSNDTQSSYSLIDKLTESQSYYYYPHNDIESLGANEAFSETVSLKNVQKTADEFLRLMDMAARVSTKTIRFRLHNFKSDEENSAPGSNVALGKPTRQSSLHLMAGNFSTATSGLLTGRYQFHTVDEPNPWWEVDLEHVMSFRKIRLHNRADEVQERASRFVILTSLNREDWNEVHRQDHPLIFGNGLQGSAFTWDCRDLNVDYVSARYVRIALLTTNYFHLDQVEIFSNCI